MYTTHPKITIYHRSGDREELTQLDGLEEKFDALLKELEIAEPNDENAQIYITHTSGWSLIAIANGLVVWQNLDEALVNPQSHSKRYMRDIPRERLIRLMVYLAQGELEKIHKAGWKQYGELSTYKRDFFYKSVNNPVKKRPVGCFFIFWWIIANATGLSLGLGISLNIDTQSLAFLITAWLVTGLLVGKTQSAVLRRQIPVSNWIWLSSLGWAVGFLTGGYFGTTTGGFQGEIILWSIFGVSLGIAQWIDLSKYINWSGWWIFINAVGMIIAGILGSLVGGVISLIMGDWPGLLVSLPLIGATNGTFTGLFLFWRLRAS